MFSEDPKYLKKHMRTTGIDVHPTEQALVVKYEVEATILGQLGDPMIGESKELQKIVRLKDLDANTDVEALTREVVQRCKLISSSRLPEVEQLIYYLQKRSAHAASASTSKTSTKAGGSGLPSTNFQVSNSADQPQERASLNKLDAYIEVLYEDIPEKVRGTQLVLQLARNPDNLDELMLNETLIGALARVLREDWKKNFDLATNITYTFFCFSTFSKFHSMISHFKVGALCLQIVESEFSRYELWLDELNKRSVASQQEKTNNQRKFDALVQKQDQLLRVCIFLLLNLSEDTKVEMKMVNRRPSGIVPTLVRILDRRLNEDLFVLTLTFLKKLSIYTENKNKMAAADVASKVCALLPNARGPVAVAAVRLLHNLAFDSQLRRAIVAQPRVVDLVPLLEDDAAAEFVLPLFYLLSMEDAFKKLVTFTDCISLCMTRVLSEEAGSGRLADCKALLINLALEPANAQLIVGDTGQGLNIIITRAYETHDVLMAKLVRNMVWHGDEQTQRYMSSWASQLADTVVAECKPGRPHLVFGLECLCVLNHLNSSAKVDWAQLLKDTGLYKWILGNLQNLEAADDDVILEAVILLGTVAQSGEPAAGLVADNSIIEPLIQLLSARQEDDELVLQIVYMFYQLMLYDSTRSHILTTTQVPAYLIDLMHDKNVQVRKICDSTLEAIAESGAEWRDRIAEERFRWHNAQWLDMVSDPDGIVQVHGEVANGDAAYDVDESDDEQNSARFIDELYAADSDENVLDNYMYEDGEGDQRPLARLQQRDSNDDGDR